MEIQVFPKHALIARWMEDQKLYTPDAETPPLCLRCGKPLHPQLIVNGLSRHIDIYICRECRTDEASRDRAKDVIPLREWYAVKHGLIQSCSQADVSLLDTVCEFRDVFDEPKRPTWFNSMGEPVSELAYSRSYYHGWRWYTTWFECREKPKDKSLQKEIDDFQSALIALPEFENLYSMGDFCRNCAEHTSESTEFNLYSATARFNVWLRMITRERDYNLYCHFYYKKGIAEAQAARE